LRSQIDKESALTVGARKNDLLKGGGAISLLPPAAVDTARSGAGPAPRTVAMRKPVAPVAAAAQPSPAKLEVIRGMKRTVESVESAQ
jgi:hypothetical protein